MAFPYPRSNARSYSLIILFKYRLSHDNEMKFLIFVFALLLHAPTNTLAQSTGYIDIQVAIDNTPITFDPTTLNALLPANVSMITWDASDAHIKLTPSDCPAGYWCPGNTLKQPCPEGTYSTTTLATSSDVCKNCSIDFPGQFCPAGATAGSPCQSGTDMLNSKGTPCPSGRYCVSGQAPSPCDAGYYIPVGSTPARGIADCAPCPVASYCPYSSVAPILCPAGTFRSTQFAGSLSECNSCPAGRWCAIASTAPTLCTGNTYSPTERAVNISTCTPCTYGAICPDGSTTSAAGPSSCPRGSYCPTNADDSVSLINCQVGTYNPSTGQTLPTACKNCSALKYCPAGSSQDGTLCPDGQYLFNKLCVPCDKGYYCSNSIAQACAAGTIQPNPGQSSPDACTPCAGGTYNSFSAMTVCSQCASGSYLMT